MRKKKILDEYFENMDSFDSIKCTDIFGRHGIIIKIGNYFVHEGFYDKDFEKKIS